MKISVAPATAGLVTYQTAGSGTFRWKTRSAQLEGLPLDVVVAPGAREGATYFAQIDAPHHPSKPTAQTFEVLQKPDAQEPLPAQASPLAPSFLQLGGCAVG